MELLYIKPKRNVIVNGEILNCFSCKVPVIMTSVHYCVRNPGPGNDKRRGAEKEGVERIDIRIGIEELCHYLQMPVLST